MKFCNDFRSKSLKRGFLKLDLCSLHSFCENISRVAAKIFLKFYQLEQKALYLRKRFSLHDYEFLSYTAK